MTPVFAKEPFSFELLEEMLPLIAAHQAELDADVVLSIDTERYAAADEAGILRIYTVRALGEALPLVGYAVFFVTPHPHRKHSVEALQDALYLSPKYRRGWTGVELVRFADRELAGDGVDVVHHHSRQPALVAILTRLGYQLTERVYARRLQ